jgi:hypothetical protein
MEKPFRYFCISAGLDKDIHNIAVAVDGLPQPKLLSADRDNNFIEMPFVSWSRPVTPDDCGIYYPEFCIRFCTVS